MVPILKMRRFSCLLRLSLPPEMGEIDFSPFHSIVNIHPPPLIPISRLRLVHWSTLKIAHDLPIFASYYAFVVFSHLIGLLSVTWLSLMFFCCFFLNLFSVSLWRRANARNVRLYYPYRQYTDLFIFRFIFRFVSLLCLRSTLRLFSVTWLSLLWRNSLEKTKPLLPALPLVTRKISLFSERHAHLCNWQRSQIWVFERMKHSWYYKPRLK